ncbi:MAG: flagellar filament capping protein FliD [Cellvibrionaceae bacterium]|nr:flagellar filament capping protein FliD [Cellvibrionaceae bacterium]
MIDNNIIKSLGAGSGIDSKALVTQLVEIERSAPQGRIDAKREKAEAQISDFGLMSAAMDKLKSALTALTSKEGLYSKSASYTSSDALVPTKLDTNVQPGTYSFEVRSLAASQSLSFAALGSPNDAVGEGVLTFNFGNWNRDGNQDPTSFVEDANAGSFSVTIDSSNNSLNGLKDAINKANKGVQASVIFDGAGYRLVVSAPSGANKELQITAAEDGDTPTNNDASGLSRFAFNANVAGIADVEKQVGVDAELVINGLALKRSTNNVTDVVEGLTLDLLKASPGEIVTVTVSDDKTFAEEKIRGFVEAYNAFLTEVKPAFSFNKEEEKWGSLANDSLAKSVVGRFRGIIGAAIPGLTNSNFSALTNLGIRTQLDGSLTINENDFSKAMSDNFADVQKLLAPYTYSSSSDITVNSFGKQTQAGSYDVVITTKPSKGYFAGAQMDAGVSFPNFDTTDKSYSFALNVNGVESGTIQLPGDVVYASATDLVSAMQSAINADSKLRENGITVVVTFDADTNSITMTSSRYGANSWVDVLSASSDAITDLGIAQGSGVKGVNVAGTVNGVPGFGLGNVLLPKLGEKAEGLSR